MNQIVINLVKYAYQFLIVISITYILCRNTLTTTEMIMIGLIAALTYLMIDIVVYLYQIYHIGDNNTSPDSPLNPTPQQYFPKNQSSEPIPSPPTTSPYSPITQIQSRWMNWTHKPNPIPLNHNTEEYKIYPGTYASRIVKPGFHDHVQPSNYDQLNILGESLTSHKPTESISMKGGGEGGKLVKLTDIEQINIQDRLTDVVYSGDLIELTTGHNVIQRATNSSQLILNTPLPKIRTNLSKLRFENAINTGSFEPIKYRQNMHIKHNALINYINQIRYIKYGERLQSHQDGPTYEIFNLINKEFPDSTDYVKYGDQFMIACGGNDQTGDKIYLKLEKDHSISSEATKEQAITFTVSLLKPANQDNLCICPNETIYP